MPYILALLLSISLPSFAQTIIPSPPKIAASGYLLIDADSGAEIVSHNADEQLPPASLTKLMTSYVLSHELEMGNVSNEDLVTISKKAWAQNPDFAGSSLMWIEVGKKVSLGDLHKGVVISSGNDASVAVAEHLSGSEDAFADVMNQHAERLGMHNTNFVNSHGLPDGNHYTTARDLAKLSAAILKYPEEYALYSEHDFTFNGITTTNRNRLLFKDSSVDGLKTGHTQEAGYCLVASAKRKKMRLISIVMGAKSESARERETQKLMAYGFRYFSTHKLYDSFTKVADAKVWVGKTNTVELGVDHEVYLTIPKGRQEEVKAVMNLDQGLRAPINKGQKYGEIVISLDNKVLAKEPLIALESVDKAGIFTRIWHEFLLLVKGLLNFDKS